MELQWINDFLALHQTRNFTRAAEACSTTQSAYSRRIQRLEDWLGSALFYREARPLTLTPAGEEFLLRAVRLREDIFDARRAVLNTSSHFKKNKRVYTTNTLAASFLSQWLIESKLEHYSLIVASISGCLEAVRRGHADLALIPHFEQTDTLVGLNATEIGEDRLILAATRETGTKIALRKNRLTGPLMVYTPGTTYGARIAAMLDKQKLHIESTPLCESASAEALLAQVKSGLGAAWIPEILLTDDTIKRCEMPASFDIPYKIFLIKKTEESLKSLPA